MKPHSHRIIIVGGAGGLELAVRLAANDEDDVLLIDSSRTHVWKPRLHEMAAGMRRGQVDELDYAGLAHYWGFAFERGALADIDAEQRTLKLAALDGGTGQTAGRHIGYQALVLALGGVTPDLGTEGVVEHAVLLDRDEDAEALFQHYSSGLLARALEHDNAAYHVVIVGSGQTGVELGAHLAADAACADLSPAAALPEIHVTLIEAADTFMPGGEGAIRDAVYQRLRDAGIEIRTGQPVRKVTSDTVETDAGECLAADLTVWAAGRVGPPVADDIQELEVNEKRQWQVRPTLQTTNFDSIFALGDCAYVADEPAPPNAQAASEQAEHLAGALPRFLGGQQPAAFEFEDKGTLLSLGGAGNVGQLRSRFSDDLQIRGRPARAAYRGHGRQHQVLLLGKRRAAAGMVSDLFGRTAGPRLKVY